MLRLKGGERRCFWADLPLSFRVAGNEEVLSLKEAPVIFVFCIRHSDPCAGADILGNASWTRGLA